VKSSPTLPAEPRHRIADTRILDAAAAVFAAEGFEGAKMETIAARAGTTKPTLYARFHSKEGLFAAAVTREYELRKDRLFEAYASGAEDPFRVRLARWTAAYFDLVRERPDGFKLISDGERHPAAAAIIERAGREIVDGIEELVIRISGREGRGGARLVASMITGMLTSCARQAVARDIDLDQAAALCESFLYAALRGLDPNLIDAASQTAHDGDRHPVLRRSPERGR
jgi:AcrR family transcriptional regulator